MCRIQRKLDIGTNSQSISIKAIEAIKSFAPWTRRKGLAIKVDWSISGRGKTDGLLRIQVSTANREWRVKFDKNYQVIEVLDW